MTDQEKRGRGRPPKAPEKGERKNYTFRLHENVREQLLQAAKFSKRTLSEEIEWRVERSFVEGKAVQNLSQELKYWMREAKVADEMIQTTVDSLSFGSVEAVQARPELLSRLTKSTNVQGILTPERNESVALPPTAEPARPIASVVDLEALIERTVERTLQKLRPTPEGSPDPTQDA